MNNPIGLFDSGVGGTSIWRQIHTLLPNEDTIYLADSKNAPYGYKTKEEIIALSFKNTEFLLNQNAKLIVVACNTATTSAIEELREKYDVPFIGIEPALKPAALQSKARKVGVLATQRTINSELFAKTRANFPQVTFVEQIGFELVQLIEAGKMESGKMDELLKEYLRPMLKAQVDCLVLGCTHYPYLIPQIEKLIPPTVQIIDSGKAVAQQTQKILQQNNLLNLSGKKGQSVFYTNADKTVLQSLVGKELLVLSV